MGSVYKRGGVWWIKYYRSGRPIRETSESDKESAARQLLRLREGDVVRGVAMTPRMGRIKYEELIQDVINDYKINGMKSIAHLERRCKLHLTPFFGGRRAASISPQEIRIFVMTRQEAGASNAEINRELSALRRGFTLAIQAGKLVTKPYFPMLRETNVRTGFFERAQFESLRKSLPEELQPVMTFAYITGWRVLSEILPLQWRQMDFDAGRVRLDPGSTKNSEAREFPMTAELRRALEEQRRKTKLLQRKKQRMIPWVFHRDGIPIKEFYGSWRTACTKAGVPGRIPHDFRRTAVRNLVRAGIPERVAMLMTGHKTRSVFERYNIVSEGDLADAARRLDQVTGTIPGTIRKKKQNPPTAPRLQVQ